MVDEFGLIRVTCKTTSCVWQGQGENCWIDKEEGPTIEDKICLSYKEDDDQSSRGDRQ